VRRCAGLLSGEKPHPPKRKDRPLIAGSAPAGTALVL